MSTSATVHKMKINNVIQQSLESSHILRPRQMLSFSYGDLKVHCGVSLKKHACVYFSH